MNSITLYSILCTTYACQYDEDDDDGGGAGDDDDDDADGRPRT